MMTKSTLSVTDLFCGAGGSSLGMHHASDDVEITLALNHWRLAVESHNANFPDTAHDCVDVSSTDPRRYRSTTVLWASPECTNHTVAKGKKRRDDAQRELFGAAVIDPADERSRVTMFDVPRFAEYHDYEVIIVENVIEVRHWRLYDAWLHAMTLLGYDHKEVYFNSMFAQLDPAAVRDAHDFAPQSRDRIYIVFWKKGNLAPDLEFRPRAWCAGCAADAEAVQSWKKPGRKWGRYKQQYVYRCPRCAAEVTPYHFAAWNAIDWSLPAERIGDRDRPLKERTMERIRKGLAKYGNTWLVMDMAYSDDERSPRPMLAHPLMTQTAQQTVAMVAPQLVSTNYYDDRTVPVTEAAGTQTTANKYGVLMPQIVTLRNNGGSEPATDGPLPTFAAAGNHVGLLMPMLMALGGRQNRDEARAVTSPLPTQTATESFGVLTPFLTSYYGQGGDSDVTVEPVPTITATDRHAVVMPMPFLAVNYSPGYARSAVEPAGAITASDHHALVTPMPFYVGYANGDGPPHATTEPLLTLHTQNNAGLVFPSTPPAVEDCGFRMLQPHEVGRGMAFPASYRVLGNKRDQVRQFGNAVTPPVAKMIMRRVIATLQ
jgi:DNA (cytosine-5)-methyltransferase 1